MGFYGECAPSNSLGFWKRMGCQHVEAPYNNSDAPWVAMTFRHEHELQPGKPTVPVTFEIHSPNGDLVPQWNFSTTAAVIEPDDLMLAEDFVAYAPKTDSRVNIRVDGIEIGNPKVCDNGDFGGTRNCPWVRVRDLALP